VASESPKDHATLLSSQMLLGNEEHGKTVNSMSMHPLQDFNCCEESSLTKSNAVWNIMTTDEPFLSPRMIVLIEALHAGKTNLYP
jgi:hypothetical protein